MNNSSFIGSRKGSLENCKKIAAKAKEKSAMVALGSDCHTSFDVGNFDILGKVLEEVDMPEDLIINTSVEGLIAWLNKNGRHVNYNPSSNI
ncbi:putative phosphatase YcdX [bioreactor metagenome]|uniref:Putative phosphatase YcdX n=1 Tax=bioreactor metagenome TaxID=1076179 RepID=A0A645JCI8_9ZZZZ